MIICNSCGATKEEDEFYFVKSSNSYQKRCKKCISEYSKKYQRNARQTEEYKERRRRQSRERYYDNRIRVNSEAKKSRNKLYIEKYPEKEKAKTLSASIKVKRGFNKHHWSYNLEHAKDIILLSRSDHYLIHRHIIYDKNTFFFKDKNGEVLDSKEKHETYIKEVIENATTSISN